MTKLSDPEQIRRSLCSTRMRLRLHLRAHEQTRVIRPGHPPRAPSTCLPWTPLLSLHWLARATARRQGTDGPAGAARGTLGAEDHAGRTKATPHQQRTCAAPTPTGGWGRGLPGTHVRRAAGAVDWWNRVRAIADAEPGRQAAHVRRAGTGGETDDPKVLKRKKNSGGAAAAAVHCLLFSACAGLESG